MRVKHIVAALAGALLTTGCAVAGSLTPTNTNLAARNIVTNETIFGIACTYPAIPAPVAKTCQTPACPQTPAPAGSDGALQKGVAWAVPRFVDNGNGTVTDKNTGLIWLKNANPFGTNNWFQALSNCSALANGMYGLTDGSQAGDWRLPNLKELTSLIDWRFSNPALANTAGTGRWTEGNPFTAVQTWETYWSSTVRAANTNNAWYVQVRAGWDNPEDKLTTFRYVWPVRGGQ
jgi:hypothetical protein